MILLDVSTCLAGFWSGHVAHQSTRAWIESANDGSLGLCRVVQLGWLRHLTNPIVLGDDALTRVEARNFVANVLDDARFDWVDEGRDIDARFAQLTSRNDRSHKLWTDDYLAAVALVGNHAFATLDKNFADRYPGLDVIDPLKKSRQ